MLRGLLGGFARGRRQTSAATLVLDFLAGLNDSRITYSGGANGTRVNSSGNIVAATTPRFDYDPVTLAAKGLLVEEARTNLLLYSQEFDNANWSSVPLGTTVTANATTSPDGTANADKLVEDSSTGLHRVIQSVVKAASAITYTQTLYIKAGERSIIQFIFTDGGGFALGHFDAATGIKDTPIVSGWTNASSTITPAGNGYYRISLTATSTTSAFVNVLYGICTGTIGAPVANYTGDGTSGFFIWSAQLEAGSFPTSYIPTTSASVTRTADSAVMTGTNFSSWYNQSEGTFVVNASVNYTAPANSDIPCAISADDGTASNRIQFFRANNSGTPFAGMVVVTGGGVAANMNAGLTQLQPGKLAGSYAANNFAVSLNGGTPTTDAAGSVPTVTQLQIGNGAALFPLNGHIRSIVFYPSARPGSLQALSS